MISVTEEQLKEKIKKLDQQARGIKEEVFKISWYMRGGVSSDDLFWKYSTEDRKVMSELIKGNIENTKNAKMPLI